MPSDATRKDASAFHPNFIVLRLFHADAFWLQEEFCGVDPILVEGEGH